MSRMYFGLTATLEKGLRTEIGVKILKFLLPPSHKRWP